MAPASRQGSTCKPFFILKTSLFNPQKYSIICYLYISHLKKLCQQPIMMGTNVKIHIIFNTSCVKMLKIHDSQHFFRIKICGAKKSP